MMELIKTLEVSAQLGEGAIWHQQQQAFWWTDIEQSKLWRYHPESEDLTGYDLPHRVGCFSPIENDERFIVATEAGLGIWRPSKALKVRDQVEYFAKPERQLPHNRFNDGKVDPQGRFWAGSMIEKFEGQKTLGSLYSVEADLSVEQQLDGFVITNTLCWNNTGDVMYHADSPTRKIYRYDYHGKKAALFNKQLFAEIDSPYVPDGAATDTEGGVWVALWRDNVGNDEDCESKLVRFDADGKVSFELTTPCSQPTCVAFGGPNNSWLMLTSAQQGLSDSQLKCQPQAGNVFIFQTEFNGTPVPAFRLADR